MYKDINECGSANNCNVNSTLCVNIPGSYICQCKKNYERIGEYECRETIIWPFSKSENTVKYQSDDKIEGPFTFKRGFPFFNKTYFNIHVSIAYCC